jgi:hypothetical protein
VVVAAEVTKLKFKGLNARIARERAAAAQLRQTIAAEVESLILGTKSPRS